MSLNQTQSEAQTQSNQVQCTLERDARGAFGLGLNDHNRITQVAPGSSAEKAGLQVAPSE